MMRRSAQIVVLLCTPLGAMSGCDSLIGESFEGYMLHREAGPKSIDDGGGDAQTMVRLDAGMDAAVEPPNAVPDAGSVVPMDASLKDGALDSAEPAVEDAGDAAQLAPIELGKQSGCEGVPFRTFDFDRDVEGWKMEDDVTVDASVTQAPGEGSPGLGALRFSIDFVDGNQGTKVFVGLADNPAVRCVSARILIAPNTFDEDLAANSGSWTLAAVSRAGCFAQRPFDNIRDLRQSGVWYEVAVDTKDLRFDDKTCDWREVGTIVVGIANAYGTTTAKPGEVFIDHVALY